MTSREIILYTHFGICLMLAVTYVISCLLVIMTGFRLSRRMKKYDPGLWRYLFVRIFHTSFIAFISRLKPAIPDLPEELQELSRLYVKRIKQNLWIMGVFIGLIFLIGLYDY